MQGEITVDSTYGEGTRFDFYIKTSIVEEGVAEPQPGENIRLISSNKNYKILIVEDIEHGRKLLINLIEKPTLTFRLHIMGLKQLILLKNGTLT